MRARVCLPTFGHAASRRYGLLRSLGPKGAKINTYNFLVKALTDAVHPGFKLFFDEDTTNGNKLMTPAEVLKLTPEPEYVMYE